MKIMAIDYGDAHTGVAVSDPTGFIAGFTTVINEKGMRTTAVKVLELAKEHNAEKIVVGRPLNMNGTAGERAEKCEAFAAMLEGYETVMWDERRTSVDANRMLSDAGKKRKKQKALVDAVAASLILEGYLAYMKR